MEKAFIVRYLRLVAIIYLCLLCLGSQTFTFRKKKVKFGTPPPVGQSTQGGTPSLRNLIQGGWSTYDNPPLALSGDLLSVSPDIAEFGCQLMTEVGKRTMQSIEW